MYCLYMEALSELIIIAKRKGVTARALAKEAGIAPNTISRWKKLKFIPHDDNYIKFIEAYKKLTKFKRLKK